MCTNTKYITNRSLHYDLYQPLKIPVSCGKCEECRRSNRNDWFVRAYYEWRSNKGSTFFYTLTYNNQNLPKYQGVPHFSKIHVQLFLKRLRFRLDKIGIKLKYLITCEKGEEKGRPHYHALFYTDKPCNCFWFLRFVEDSWQYGFVKTGDNCGLVNSSVGIQYVTKYVTKDYSQLDKVQPFFAPACFNRYYRLFNYIASRYHSLVGLTIRMNPDYSFSRVILDGFKPSDADLELQQKILIKMRRFMNMLLPFHLQSTKLGQSIAFQSSVELEKVPVMQHGKCTMYKLPRYIKRMLWYDCIEGQNSHKRDTFVLNDEGKKHVFGRFDSEIQKDADIYQMVVSSPTLLTSRTLRELKQSDYGFENIMDIRYFLGHLDVDLEVLAIYKNIFRGRVCTFNIDLKTEDVRTFWKDYAFLSLQNCCAYDYGEIHKDSKLVNLLNSHLWNLHPFFQPYEFVLCILEKIINVSAVNQSAATIETDRKAAFLRNYYKTIV